MSIKSRLTALERRTRGGVAFSGVGILQKIKGAYRLTIAGRTHREIECKTEEEARGLAAADSPLIVIDV